MKSLISLIETILITPFVIIGFAWFSIIGGFAFGVKINKRMTKWQAEDKS